MENKRFLNASDVAEFMGISVPMAYKIIRRLNEELSAQGCLRTKPGCVLKRLLVYHLAISKCTVVMLLLHYIHLQLGKDMNVTED